MKKLIILTHAFPYKPPTEQFLSNEIMITKNYFDLVYVVPTSHTAWETRTLIKNSDNVRDIRLIRKNKLIEIITSLVPAIILNKEFYQEIIILIKHNQLFNSKAIKALCLTMINSKIISDSILNFLNENLKKNDQIYLYSYWLSHLAHAASKIKKQLIKMGYNNVIVFSRAHGYSDIFSSLDMKNYKPSISFMNKNLDQIYSISNCGKKYLEKIGFEPGLLKVDRLGVPDNGFKQIIDRKPCFLIVSCSFLVKIKRVDLIVKALLQIKHQKIKWVHFGDGPEREYIEELMRNKENGIIDFVLLGKYNNSEIINFYKDQSPDLFINTSSVEGIPVSIMEAISFGIPVIACNVGGNAEICFNNYNGVLLNSDFTIDQLANTIRFFIEMDGSLYKSYCLNSRRVFLKYYNNKKNYNKFAKDLLKLMEVPKK